MLQLHKSAWPISLIIIIDSHVRKVESCANLQHHFNRGEYTLVTKKIKGEWDQV